ncbi:Dbl homology domain-containing protein [Naematelia encephala]|uniref:Dbl homology domain-containing protein n=1 Tax=Naematelia encephala TaxID=71784 RepID=A0A1Y2B4N8_9TREE|nr:Dbl homology domain-containing protein [Naematelia encephala]
MTTLSGKARSHQSLPPLPRNSSQAGSYLSGKSNRMSFQPGRRNDSRVASAASLTSLAAKDVQLPEDLEKVLTVLSGGILEGHLKLAAALRKRYENQYPLVRSLADVFNTHAYLFKEYSAYVLHLERALDTIDHALNLALTKRSSRASSDSPMMRLGRVLLSLEEVAAERGESGLSISLAKPFQRLLKYPLLFQNLLFNTDPSLKEYEATLGMVDQVEEIVRSIEDEKSSSEERERTRDVWARIEGLENDKVLMTPKADRLLVSETQVPSIEGQKRDDGTKKKSLKRLSDILKGPIDADLWIVRFSDVSLLCLRIGVTHLPISGTKGKVPKSESANDLGGRRGHGARRVQSIRARNLYRFVKVQEWNLKQKVGNSEGL